MEGSVSQTYNNDFRVSAQSINGGSATTFNYDNDGLLTVAGSEIISRNTATGQIEAITLGGTTETRLYNTFSEVSSIQGNAYAESMLYDNLGRISQKEETSSFGNHTYNYGYDPNGRLKTVSKDTVLEKTYNYDSNGNRTSVVGSSTTTGTYDDQDRLMSYGTLTFTYSNDGELTRKTDTSTSETTQYVTDALGNLKSVLLPSGTQIDYLTDGLNRRVAKKVNGTTTQKFLYQDQLKIAAELDTSNAIVSRFVYGAKSNIPDYMIKLGTTYRIFSDHLGSPRAVVNVANGSVAQAIEYDEFGNITVDTNPGFVPFGFAGCLYDNDTKLCRFGARDYSSEIGRWVQKDPIGFASSTTNLYEYALSDPVNFVDINGFDVWLEGPSGSEPAGHYSVAVGNPNGTYKAYSFGLENLWKLRGEVYVDVQPKGKFIPGYYRSASVREDQAAMSYLNSLVGKSSGYGASNTCRDFSRKSFSDLTLMGIGTPSSPPVSASRSSNYNSIDVPFWSSSTIH